MSRKYYYYWGHQIGYFFTLYNGHVANGNVSFQNLFWNLWDAEHEVPMLP
jgi:hypothetical protein